MKILIAEDDPVIRRLLEASLTRAGYEVVTAVDGGRAWEILQRPDTPRLVLMDWMMPVVDGVEVCRRIRAMGDPDYTYIIMLTAKGRKEDVVTGLEAGADDYLTKPFDPREMRSRVHAGRRILDLGAALRGKVRELEDALAQVDRLQGLLPICMHCKRIRDASDGWHQLESYISQHSEAEFTHSLCQECLQKYYPAKAAAVTAGKA